MTDEMVHARLISGLVILLAVGGCEGPSYKATPATTVPAGEKEVSSQYGAPFSILTVPYSDPERQKTFFDADFTEAGILAIQLQVRNTTDQAAHVRREDMTLTLPSGHRLSPMSAHSAANLIDEKAGTGITVGDIFSDALRDVTGGLVSGGQPHRRAERSRGKRVADYQAKAFKNAHLAPGESTSGFVFFRPPHGTPAFDKAELNVLFVPVTGATGKIVAEPVGKLGFAGIEADPEATIYIPRSQRGFKRCDMAEIDARPWTGNWKAQYSQASLTVDISDSTVIGKISTPTHVYRVNGVVDANGAIVADIEYGDTEDKATLSGDFPKLRTVVDSAKPGIFWPLSNVIFRLCT